MVTLRVSKTPALPLSFTGRVYLNEADFQALCGDAVETTLPLEVTDGTTRSAFTAAKDPRVEAGTVALNSMQRVAGGVEWMVGTEVRVTRIRATHLAHSVKLKAERLGKVKPGGHALSAQELTDRFGQNFGDQMVFRGAQFAFKAAGATLKVTVLAMELLDLGEASAGTGASRDYARLDTKPNVSWETGEAVAISGNTSQSTLFDSNFDFGKLGIGGLGAEFSLIFRRAFAPRCFSSAVINQLGIKHIRGMMLYGPPGCGKTLIARKIGQVLNAREPQIINGPEILNKFVGASEEAIREKFALAEEEQRDRGDDSELHIIIFDEIDAICKQRGSSNDGTGVGDSVVNQLLSKLDGVESLNNILVIGMTNRMDMIDEALLRPGRLELHVEIGLPDQPGRLQILKIHTKSMRTNGRITDEAVAYLPELAERTKNYSGAEIEGLVRAAAQYALRRGLQTDDEAASRQIDLDAVIVEKMDLENAFHNDTSPAFGNDEAELATYFPNGIIEYGPRFSALQNAVQLAIEQVKSSPRSPITSMLLYGPPKSGKTALMTKLALNSDIPFVRLISADSLVGRGDMARVDKIAKAFKDSYRSRLSVILLDDIERLLEYVRIGPRFSNAVLQAFLVLLKKLPPSPHRLLVIATTSAIVDLDALGLADMFDLRREVPKLSDPAEIATVLSELPDLEIEPGEDVDGIAQQVHEPIGIKQLMTIVERARVLDPNGRLNAHGFGDALLDAITIPTGL